MQSAKARQSQKRTFLQPELEKELRLFAKSNDPAIGEEYFPEELLREVVEFLPNADEYFEAYFRDPDVPDQGDINVLKNDPSWRRHYVKELFEVLCERATNAAEWRREEEEG